jgi:hypothetical protein
MSWFGETKVTTRARDRVPAAVPGPLTAREALQAVLPAVEKVSRRYHLGMVTSGEDIAADGRSARWEFLLSFPARQAAGVFGVEPCDIENSETALCVTIDVAPGLPRFESPLPLDFRDSPAVVAEMAEAGVDWVTGSTRMTLASRRTPAGMPVWFTEMFGKEYEVPFSGAQPGR